MRWSLGRCKTPGGRLQHCRRTSRSAFAQPALNGQAYPKPSSWQQAQPVCSLPIQPTHRGSGLGDRSTRLPRFTRPRRSTSRKQRSLVCHNSAVNVPATAAATAAATASTASIVAHPAIWLAGAGALLLSLATVAFVVAAIPALLVRLQPERLLHVRISC